MTYFTSINAGNQITIGGNSINIVTEPVRKLYVNGQQVNLTTAKEQQMQDGSVLYTDIPNLPGVSIKFFGKDGFTLYSESNGVVSRFGTMTKEEEAQLSESLAQMQNNMNKQMQQVQQQIGNMMQSLNNMFSRPGWPFA